MPDTQNLKVSQFTFDQVEAKLQAVKLDQPSDHFLNGEGNYVQITATGGTQYDDTDIKNSIGTLTDLTTTEQNSLVGAINELDVDKADKIDLDAYTTTDDMNLLLDDKADKTDLDNLATETFVVEKINEASLNNGGQQVDLSVYATKDSLGELTDLTTTEKDTIVGAINELKTTVDSKPNGGTTLAEYGITDSYTKSETDNKIIEEVNKASHLKREIVTQIPSIDMAEENVVYMLKVDTAKGSDLYQEWMLIDGDVVLIGDTSVDMSNYQDKITGSKGQVLGFDDDGNPIAIDIELNKQSYVVETLPEGSVVDYREKEIRILCPSTAVWTQQQVGTGGDPNRYYITLKTYAPEDATKFKKVYKETFETSDAVTEMAGSDRVGQDSDGRKFLYSWITASILNPDDGQWTYQGKDSTVDNYNGVYQSVEFYNENDVLIGSDCIRINFSNEDCHGNIKPFYASELGENITVDDTLDKASDNPISNKAVATKIEELEARGTVDTYEIITCDITDITDGLSEFTVSNFSKTFAETYVSITNSKDVILKANYATENYVYVLHPSAVNNTMIAFSTATNDKALTITIKNDNSLTGEIVTSGGDVITTDDAPTPDSTNPVESGGVYTALESKQDKITGTKNQIVAIGADGNTTVIDGSVIDNIEYTPSTADDGNNVLKINLSDGNSKSFNIKNGSKGDKGDKGATGTRGSRWSTGTAITGTSTTATVFSGTGITDALVNDMYLNTSTGNTYRCTVAGNTSTAKWVYAGCIKGASATSAIADVAWKSVDTSVKNSNLAVQRALYCVKNGICYVTGAVTATDAVNSTQHVGLVPKCGATIYAPVAYDTPNSFGTPFVQVSDTGYLSIGYPAIGETMFFNFSYPVVT